MSDYADIVGSFSTTRTVTLSSGACGIVTSMNLDPFTELYLSQVHSDVQCNITNVTETVNPIGGLGTAFGNSSKMVHEGSDSYSIGNGLALDFGVLNGFYGDLEIYSTGAVPVLKNKIIFTADSGTLTNTNNNLIIPLNTLYTPLKPIQLINNSLKLALDIYWSWNALLDVLLHGASVVVNAHIVISFIVKL